MSDDQIRISHFNTDRRCGLKRQLTKAQARRMMCLKGNKGVTMYKCDQCSFYHTGHKNKDHYPNEEKSK